MVSFTVPRSVQPNKPWRTRKPAKQKGINILTKYHNIYVTICPVSWIPLQKLVSDAFRNQALQRRVLKHSQRSHQNSPAGALAYLLVLHSSPVIYLALSSLALFHSSKEGLLNWTFIRYWYPVFWVSDLVESSHVWMALFLSANLPTVQSWLFPRRLTGLHGWVLRCQDSRCERSVDHFTRAQHENGNPLLFIDISRFLHWYKVFFRIQAGASWDLESSK